MKKAHARSKEQALEFKKMKDPIQDRIHDKKYIEKLTLEYYNNVISSEEISKYILTYSQINNIDPALLTALIKTESNYNPLAVNYNTNGSIDRGLCQLNNKTFPELSVSDFFDPELNIRYGSNFLNWCIRISDNNLVKALAFYNAGYGNVTNRKVGEITLNYINKIFNEKSELDRGLKKYIERQSPDQ